MDVLTEYIFKDRI